MSSPYGYYGRYAAFPYQLATQFWPMGATPTFAVALPHPYPQLQQQPAFPNPLPHPACPSQPVPPPFTPLITRTRLAAPAGCPEDRARQWPQGPGNKIQKTDEVKESAPVIEISDEEEEPQVEKTPPFKIPDVNRTVQSTSTSTQKRPQNTHTTKSQPTPPPPPKDATPKQKPLPKPHKPKQITKKLKITEQPPKKTAPARPTKPQQPRRTFLSQRIRSKVQAKRNLYRLSRKEKNVLEVTLLRNHVNEILTGPQFQAKLPPLPASQGITYPHSDFAARRNTIREALLTRLYQDEEED